MNTTNYNITPIDFQGKTFISNSIFKKKGLGSKREKQHKNIFFIGFAVYMYILIFHFTGTMYQ